MRDLEIDHLLIAAPDLQSGSDFVKQQLGVAPVTGGVHPGMGTRNALLGLGDDSYLEVIAPDPLQSPELAMSAFLAGLESPALMWWAVRCAALDQVEIRVRQLGLNIVSKQPGSRSLPDGSELHWRVLLAEAEDLGSALPFFIEWQDMSMHPARNLPAAGKLSSMQITHPNAGQLQAILGTDLNPILRVSNTECATLQVEIDTGRRVVPLMTPAHFPPGLGTIVRRNMESKR